MIASRHVNYPGFAVALALTLAALMLPGTARSESGDSAAASRIVAVGGSVTEVVFALGEQDRLIARDSTSIHPQAAHDLPNIGYIRALSPEGVMSVDPDLILLLNGSGPPETLEVLKDSGIAIADIPDRFTPEGIVAKIRAIGEALGAEDKAKDLARKVEADLKDAISSAAKQSKQPRVLFVLSANGGRILASGTDTAADGIIKMAGAVNAVTEFTGYKQLSDEAILTAAPDAVLMMARGGDHGATAEELFAHPAFSQTPAAKEQSLIKMPGVYLLGFGPRTASAVKELAGHLAKVRN